MWYGRVSDLNAQFGAHHRVFLAVKFPMSLLLLECEPVVLLILRARFDFHVLRGMSKSCISPIDYIDIIVDSTGNLSRSRRIYRIIEIHARLAHQFLLALLPSSNVLRLSAHEVTLNGHSVAVDGRTGSLSERHGQL